MLVKLSRGNLSARLIFARPLMTFQEAPSRFFEATYSAISPAYPVSTNEFSANPSTRLSDVWARFNLYNGPNAVTLYADRLAFDFINLLEADYQVVYDIMHRMHDALPPVLPSIKYRSVEVQSFIHFELQSPHTAPDYLQRFCGANLSAFAPIGEVIEEPAARFAVKAADGAWRCSFGVARSLTLSNGVFVDWSLTLDSLVDKDDFVNKLKFAAEVSGACVSTLGLELEDANR